MLYGTDKIPSLARRLSIMKATLKQLVFDKLQNNEQLPDWL
nr:MAG TPA: mttA/Hcf106 family protein [Bacteriophage sp.]